MSDVWTHEGDKEGSLWKSIKSLHSLIWFGIYIEIFLTLAIILLLLIDFGKTYGKPLNPLVFDYQKEEVPIDEE